MYFSSFSPLSGVSIEGIYNLSPYFPPLFSDGSPLQLNFALKSTLETLSLE